MSKPSDTIFSDFSDLLKATYNCVGMVEIALDCGISREDLFVDSGISREDIFLEFEMSRQCLSEHLHAAYEILRDVKTQLSFEGYGEVIDAIDDARNGKQLAIDVWDKECATALEAIERAAVWMIYSVRTLHEQICESKLTDEQICDHLQQWYDSMAVPRQDKLENLLRVERSLYRNFVGLTGVLKAAERSSGRPADRNRAPILYGDNCDDLFKTRRDLFVLRAAIEEITRADLKKSVENGLRMADVGHRSKLYFLPDVLRDFPWAKDLRIDPKITHAAKKFSYDTNDTNDTYGTAQNQKSA